MDKSGDRFEILHDQAALARHVAEWMTSAALAAKGPISGVTFWRVNSEDTLPTSHLS